MCSTYSPGTISPPKLPPRQGWHSSKSSWRRRRRKAGTQSWLGHRATSNAGKGSRQNAPANTSQHSFLLGNCTFLERVAAVNVTGGTARRVCSAATCGPCVHPWYTRINYTSNTLFVQHVLQGNPGMEKKKSTKHNLSNIKVQIKIPPVQKYLPSQLNANHKPGNRCLILL